MSLKQDAQYCLNLLNTSNAVNLWFQMAWNVASSVPEQASSAAAQRRSGNTNKIEMSEIEAISNRPR